MINKYLYTNAKQDAVLSTDLKRRSFVGGRGSGKTVVIGDYCFDCMDLLPKSSGAIWAPTMEIITGSTLPEVVSRWEAYDLEEGEDFVLFKQPPSHFDRPFRNVKKYDNVISFANGTVIYLISLYAERAARGLSIQWGAGDEMGFIKKSRFTQNIRPAMRGYRQASVLHELESIQDVPFGEVKMIGSAIYWRYLYEECPLYRSFLNVTSMPYLDEGKWILQTKEDPKYFYIESTPYDNIEVLGEQYIIDLKEEMDDLEFRVEVMNENIEQLPDGFYPNFRDNVHTTMVDHYDDSLPLDISFDFGRFNCLTLYQEIGKLAAGIDSMYIKRDTILELVDKFIEKYKNHKKKDIFIYGDRNGNNSRADSKKTYYQEIVERLTKAGWHAVNMVKGLDPNHADKHLLLSAAMKEDSPNLPKIRFHQIRCKYVIISIKKAPIKDGLKKDKSSERSLKIDQTQATHFSDTFDNWYYAKYRRLYKSGRGSAW